MSTVYKFVVPVLQILLSVFLSFVLFILMMLRVGQWVFWNSMTGWTVIVPGLIVLYFLLIYKLISKKISMLLRVFISFGIILLAFFSILSTHKLLLRNSLHYFLLMNKNSFDNTIPIDDIRDIQSLAKIISNLDIKSIRYHECNPKEKSVNEVSFEEPKKSLLCQKGDILLKVGVVKNEGIPLGGEGHGHYYLLRKMNGKWQIIEDLGEYSWIS